MGAPYLSHLRLPGEKVRIKIVEEKPRYVLASLEEILVPSEQRVTPRCSHFGVCGGCHYQHLSYGSQIVAKSKILGDQLMRIGKLTDVPILPVSLHWMSGNIAITSSFIYPLKESWGLAKHVPMRSSLLWNVIYPNRPWMSSGHYWTSSLEPVFSV